MNGPLATADQPSSIIDAPVADMALIAPADYQEASALAATGRPPVDIALSIVGEFEGTTQQILQVNKGSEAPSASSVTVVRDGLLDDSVRAQRWEIALERTSEGTWAIREVRKAWLCRRCAQQQFGTTACR
ncbi:MAG: hypothetical protein MUO39_12340 [Steroidobacteraceae bacterium]|nr:hypothetical protein [Steroidobacteraceae bacterium]